MRLILADGRAEVRSALRLAVEQEPLVTVVGEAASTQELIARVQSEPADLVLLDWDLPGARAVHLIPVLRSLNPALAVVVLSGCPEARQLALGAGANAFVCKCEGPDSLASALRLVRPPASNSHIVGE